MKAQYYLSVLPVARNDWNKILLSPLVSLQIYFMSRLLAIRFNHIIELKQNAWRCLAKTVRLRTKTQSRSLKGPKPGTANLPSAGIFCYTKRGVELFTFNTFYRNFGVNTSWGGDFPVWISEFHWVNLLESLYASSWDLWKLYWNTFCAQFSSFFLNRLLFVFVTEPLCVLSCSSQNILWRATLTQRFNDGAVRQFVLSVSQLCMTFFLSYSFPFKASLI